MSDPRKNIIILVYGVLLFHSTLGKTHAVFVYLFILLIELILLVLLYGISNFASKEKSKIDFTSVMIGAVPLALFSYCIIYLAAIKFDGVDGFNGFLYPVSIFKKQVLLGVIGILIGYSSDFWKRKKVSYKLKVIESKVIYQGLKLWVLGALTIVIMTLIPTKFYPFGISILPIARIVMEFSWNKINLDNNQRKWLSAN